MHWEKLEELYNVDAAIMGLPQSTPVIAPNSKLAKLFAEASTLPGSQQRKIVELFEDIVTAQKIKATN